MKILKFGGTSVGCPKGINNVISIVREEILNSNCIIVVSAFSGVTDMIQKCALQASEGDKNCFNLVKSIESRHTDISNDIFSNKEQKNIIYECISNHIDDFTNIIKGVYILKEISDKINNLLLSYGEKLSSIILFELFKFSGIDINYMDASKVIITEDSSLNIKVNKDETNKNINKFLNNQKNYILPGFIASTLSGEISTLGRGGSDYSAALIAAGTGASILKIWTDVDGMMTADPSLVREAYPIENLSYEEAMELSFFGARVIYAPTIHPVMQKNIPICIKNTYNPKAIGTKINGISNDKNKLIKGVSAIQNISVLSVSGSSIIGYSNVSKRLFSVLSDNSVNIFFITQASSEFSISIAISEKDINKAIEVINSEFEYEVSVKKALKVESENNMSIIAIVGDNMRKEIGVSGRTFKILGKNGINIRAISQGANERNLSFIVKNQDTQKALNVLHEGFFLSELKKIHLFMMGVGNVGSELIKQIKDCQQHLKDEYFLNAVVIGIANSRQMLFDKDGVDLNYWDKSLKESSTKSSIDSFIKTMKDYNLSNSIFIDNTASDSISEKYSDILSSSLSIVASNKIAASSDICNYLDLKKISRKRNVSFLYETNVGAGLPLIKTINDMINSGDKVNKIEAVLSGSLNYIFNEYKAEESFATIVKKAMKEGYTEPDPRVDLSGVDVSRKILILSRECGEKLNINDVTSKSFLPDECSNCESVDDFLNLLESKETFFKEMYINSKNSNKKLKYVAEYENGRISTSLKAIDKSHPLYHTNGKDNTVLIHTLRYNDQPLIIKGAGAGAGVTASGVFADIMRIANL